jgi:hypothetical protein
MDAFWLYILKDSSIAGKFCVRFYAAVGILEMQLAGPILFLLP